MGNIHTDDILLELEKGPHLSIITLINHLIEKAHIALVPGSAFGMPGYLRLSYATSMDNLKETIKRIFKLT